MRFNFAKLAKKKGISLIVLIVTIIVIIILATAVILTITKNNPISSAKEATFKEDISNIQNELSMYLSKKYTDDPLSFEKSSVNLSRDSMVTELPSTKNYKGKISIINGNLVWDGKTENNTEYKWFDEVIRNTSNVKEEWQNTIVSVKDGVPIPKGFTYKEGTKEKGLVIQDKNGNEFVWVPVDGLKIKYKKDISLPSLNNLKPTSEDLEEYFDETAGIKKYGGFYIGRYEAGIPEEDTSPSNKSGTPVSKKDATVWTNINYTNAKSSAESMISNDYVQTGLLTGKAWDTTCHWIEDSLSNFNLSAKLTNSVYYGNYKNSKTPADENNGTKRSTGSNENWKIKNIYDLAGNVWEWTNEIYESDFFIRGGGYNSDGSDRAISYRYNRNPSFTYDDIGFRVKLYIK